MIPSTPPAIYASPAPTLDPLGREFLPAYGAPPTPTVTPTPMPSPHLTICRKTSNPRIRHGLAGWWDSEYGYVRIFWTEAFTAH